jgi:hypothetical protein
MRNRILLALGVAAFAAPTLHAQATPDSAARPKPAAAKADSTKARHAYVKPRVDFDKFKFMEGCWRGRIDKDTEVEEIWTSPAENLLLAVTRYFNKDRATGYEFTRIEGEDSTVVFAARSEGRPEDVYPLKQIADDYVLFENPAKTFPKRIMYRLTDDGVLIPRNEGDGPSVEIRMHREKCPGADIKLKP